MWEGWLAHHVACNRRGRRKDKRGRQDCCHAHKGIFKIPLPPVALSEIGGDVIKARCSLGRSKHANHDPQSVKSCNVSLDRKEATNLCCGAIFLNASPG